MIGPVLSRYAFAAGVSAIAILITTVAPGLLSRPYLLSAAAVALSAWLGGARPALFSTALSTVAINVAIVALRARPWGAIDFALGLAFIAIGVLIATFAHTHARSEREVQRHSRRMEAIFRQASTGIALLALDGRLTRINQRMAAIIGRSPDEATAWRYGEIIHPEDWATTGPLVAALATAVKHEVTVDNRIVRSDGSITWVHASLSPLLGSDGQPEGLIAIVEDVSARHGSELRLRASEERARLALEIAELGTFTWLRSERHLATDARCREIFGMSGRDDVQVRAVLERVHPDDRQRLQQAFLDALAGRRSFAEEARFIQPDGAIRWTVIRGEVMARADGPAASGEMMIASVMDVTEERQTEEALRRADREKDDFLALLAHELRNPLAPIRTAVQLLKVRRPSEDEVQRLHAVIDRQVQHLVRMVDDLLDVSRMLRGKVELRPEPLDAAAAIAVAVEASRPMLDAQRHQLTLAIPEHPLTVHGDQVRLSQVIANLLNNASTYTDPGGTIHVTARQSSGAIEIEVRDSGVGIAADMLPRIFEPFVQADRSLERTRGGLGIGLTLVKRIVELHHGTVAVQSDGAGTGSTFTIRLPATGPGAALRTPPPADPVVSRCPLRIVVVDDNVDAVDSLSMLLRADGHTTSVAYDGMAAMTEIDACDPDLVILDIGLPGMSGYEVAALLRQRGEACPHLIAVTGYGQPGDARRAFEAGFQHHLVKPVDARELQLAIASCLPRPTGGAPTRSA